MKANLKIIIPIIISIAVIIAALLLIKFEPNQKSGDISPLSTAQKYLTELNYEQAIIEFKKAIELDPMNGDAYLGLAQAYEKLGDIENAVAELEKGYKLTGDERLKAALESIVNLPAVSELSETAEQPIVVSESQKLINIKGERYGYDITELNLSGKEIKNFDIDKLYKMEQLKKLDISNNLIESIEYFPSLVNLEWLNISYNPIADVSPLMEMKQLRYLDISGISIGKSEYDDLCAALPECEIVMNVVINGISCSPDITELDLTGMGLTDKDISLLFCLPALERLTVRDNNIDYISAFTDLYHLRYLDITGNKLDRNETVQLRQTLPDCEVVCGIFLDDSNYDISVESIILSRVSSIDGIQQLKNLKSVHIENPVITNYNMLSQLNSVTELWIYGNEKIGTEEVIFLTDCSALSELTGLEYLNLSINRITDISGLADMTNLKKLTLDSNLISDISVLSGLTSLEDLDLSYNQITDISALYALTNLRHLDLSRNPVTEAEVEKLRTALPNCEIFFFQ